MSLTLPDGGNSSGGPSTPYARTSIGSASTPSSVDRYRFSYTPPKPDSPMREAMSRDERVVSSEPSHGAAIRQSVMEEHEEYEQLGFSRFLQRLADSHRREWAGVEQEGVFNEKLVVIGDASTGKTSLIVRAVDHVFSQTYQPTIGVDFMRKDYEIGSVPFQLLLWDTAGQEKFRSMSSAYYRGALGCMLVFDLGSMPSLRNAERWLAEVRKEACTEGLAVFLVGCKSDMYHVVSAKDATQVARSLGAEYFECSAKHDHGVQELFDRVALVMLERSLQRPAPKKSERVSVTASVDTSRSSSSSSCRC